MNLCRRVDSPPSSWPELLSLGLSSSTLLLTPACGSAPSSSAKTSIFYIRYIIVDSYRERNYSIFGKSKKISECCENPINCMELVVTWSSNRSSCSSFHISSSRAVRYSRVSLGTVGPSGAVWRLEAAGLGTAGRKDGCERGATSFCRYAGK